MAKIRLPHPVVLLLGAIALAALCTWIIPAGEYQRALNEATARTVVVPGTYARIAASPVGLFDLFVAIPRGIKDGADVIATILFVGGAFVVAERLGTLGRLLSALAVRLGSRGLLALPILGMVFGAMGGLENMQEEIIAMVPVLLVLGRRIGVDALAMVAVSAGAAVVGSAFGPANPYQAGLAMKIAELPPLEGGLLRSAMWLVAMTLWIGWTMRYSRRNRIAVISGDDTMAGEVTSRDVWTLTFVVGPILMYVVGAVAWGWGFDHLSAATIVGLFGGGWSTAWGPPGSPRKCCMACRPCCPQH